MVFSGKSYLGGSRWTWIIMEALLVKLVMKPGGTPANQHPILTTCIQNTTSAGDQLCCCFDQREREREKRTRWISGKQFWDSCVLGMSFRVFWVGHDVYFGNTLESSASRCCLCICLFWCILGYIFKHNISMTTLSYDVVVDAVMAEGEAIMMLQYMFLVNVCWKRTFMGNPAKKSVVNCILCNYGMTFTLGLLVKSKHICFSVMDLKFYMWVPFLMPYAESSNLSRRNV